MFRLSTATLPSLVAPAVNMYNHFFKGNSYGHGKCPMLQNSLLEVVMFYSYDVKDNTEIGPIRVPAEKETP